MSNNTETRLFTDEQILEACGMKQDNLRKLITWKAVSPVQSGGGRGKVRLWNSRQVNRICVTEQFRAAGFSLRMAHTLSYALPLDDMLTYYDIDMLENDPHRTDPGIARLLAPEPYVYEMNDDRIGHVVIVNNEAVYTDAVGDEPVIFGIFNWDDNTFNSIRKVDEFWGGPVFNSPGMKYPNKLDVSEIDRSSLLIDELDHGSREFMEYMEACHYPWQITPPFRYGQCTMVLRLYIGLEICFRKLLGLAIRYE